MQARIEACGFGDLLSVAMGVKLYMLKMVRLVKVVPVAHGQYIVLYYVAHNRRHCER